jgi:hypothetical protein
MVTMRSSSSTSARSSTTSAAPRAASSSATVVAPGMSSTFGERASSQAIATCSGPAPTRSATAPSTSVCCGFIRPIGKNDV